MELGPEIRFIIRANSSNSYSAKICHIVAKDVAQSDNKVSQNVFFTDNFITEEDPHNDALKHWEKSLKSQQFRINFLTLNIVNDLLHLNDTLGINAWNYGAIMQEFKTTEPQYKAILIDHEIRNSCFEYEPDKNPVFSLIDKLSTNNRKQNIEEELISYKIIKENKHFIDPNEINLEL